jgi:phage-related baseplate assembly protein
MLNLKKIPAPKIFESLSYEEILEEKKSIIKKIKPDWESLESDDFVVLSEAWAFDDIYHRQKFNNAIKSMLLPYSTGSDLDNLAVMYGIARLCGTEPVADYEFIIAAPLNTDTVIPKDTVLTSDDGKHFSKTCEHIIIKAGETKAYGKAALNNYVKSSAVKTEIFVSPIPLVKVKALEIFDNGSKVESDEDFRERILLSLYASSTAGSRESYIYWTRSADTRIKDVNAVSNEPGIVDVYILVNSDDFKDDEDYESLKNKCIESCCDEKKRPLTDKVNFHFAEIIEVEVKAKINLLDLAMKNQIEKFHFKQIKAQNFELGDSLNLSWLYSLLHTEGVEKVEILNPQKSIEIGINQAIKIKNIISTYG